MRNATTVLMYHAIAEAGRECAEADPRYTVGRADFRRQLAAIEAAGLRAASLATLLERRTPGAVAITFDDGHESNAIAAADLLARCGSADLFVNPSRVGTKHFLDWAALRDLAAAGLSIQSHGETHRYLDDLGDAEIERELAVSKARIEERVGRPVTLFAPPGGRLPARALPVALRVGYRALCSSVAGLWRGGAATHPIPRLAVLAATGDTRFCRWILQEPWEIARLAVRHRVLAGAKTLLGNGGYERVRARLLARRGEAA
ncbi:MAG TPA: polysaccharide deacetylase family protein [Usitatibacter sp.]|nr:polysaccharide deacetylase family protein [Usitatibacter sp.]